MSTVLNHTIRRVKTAIAISSFLFLLSILITDLNMGGAYTSSGYALTKMALGSLGIGLGFGLPGAIYDREGLSLSVKILIHMGIGCTVMLMIAFLVDWIPVDKGLWPAVLAISSMLLTAFVVWVFTYQRQKKLAERINRELKQRQKQ